MKEYIAPSDKYFYTVDGKVLFNLYQLVEYLNQCSDEAFNFHVNSGKNDFYNWIRDVFNINISEKLRDVNNRSEFSKIIRSFLEENQHMEINNINNDSIRNDDKNIGVVDSSFNNISNNNINVSSEVSDYNTSVNDSAYINKHNSNDASENQVFHEFTDKELEKFTKFSSKEKETSFNDKVEYLKSEYIEMKNMIKDLRKSGKDLIIADLLLRVVEPKIAYYEQSNNIEDYNKVLNILNDIKREVEYASQQNEITLADEIIKQLELQSLTMKKNFETKKQANVFEKIFKKSNKEITI